MVFARHCAIWFCVVVAGEPPAASQPAGHEAHHPATADAGVAPPDAGPTDGGAPAMGMGRPASGTGMGMGMGMDGMMGPPPAGGGAIYPTLMAIDALTPEARARIDGLAAAELAAGTSRLRAAADALAPALQAGDHARTQQALEELRAAVGRVESAVAARRVLAEGTSPRATALRWFRRELDLASVPPADHVGGLAGLSWMHVFTMALVGAFATVLLATQVVRARRARELLASLQTAPAAAPAAAPPPVVAAAAPRSAWKGKLEVASVFEETRVVKTFRLMTPDGAPRPFTFAPGQYLNLSVTVGERRLTRSYTIASSPTQRDHVEVTIKREEKGLVSRHLHDAVAVGAELDVAGPFGSFVFTGQEADSVVLVAGGVGITPMMSMIRFLSDRSWVGEIFLVYGCRSAADFVFEQELATLERRHPRLHVVVVIERPEGTDWRGPTGYITRDVLVNAVPQLTTRRIHLCGPPGMMAAMRALFSELGVPPEHLKTEAFVAAAKDDRPPTTVASVVAQPAVAAAGASAPLVTFIRSNRAARIRGDRSVLELADEIGVGIDSQCRVGTCGQCKVKLVSGQVTMAVEDALDPGDKAGGIVLACQARPTSDVAIEA